MPDTSERAEYEYLQTTVAIRECAERIFDAATRGDSRYFRLRAAKLPAVSERVLTVTKATYPDLLAIPYHGRYRHFDAGGVPRLERFQASLNNANPDDQLRSRTELVITSVLLDAGAGPSWAYRESEGGSYARSEGLAVASYHWFSNGGFSSTGRAEADAAGLSSVTSHDLERAFQVSPQNPLTGAEGRAHLLRELGAVVGSSPRYFSGRLGDLGVYLRQQAQNDRLPATSILAAVLDALGPIWPGRERLAGKALGDVWRHSRFGLVPFHKLSQWLSYSLLEPLEAAGVTVTNLDALTGLPEYRNGGLFLDGGVLELIDEQDASREHEVASDLVIEWRALTIALLDRLADGVRARLSLSATQLPLACVLQGGSWSAGRAIAAELRPGGGPPLRIRSDGTVF